MPTKIYIPNKYLPNASRSGSGSQAIYRGKNMFIRGRGADTYAEVYGGSLNLNEDLSPVALTGTISFSPSSRLITGTTTIFLTELHLGQCLVTLEGEILHVETILSDTEFIAHQKPLSTETEAEVYRMHILNEVNRQRASLLSGNIFEADTGNFLAVGSGTVRLNGQPLDSNFEAEKRAKVALYEPGTDSYLIQTLGFDGVPTGATADPSATTGTKIMPGGDRSILIAKASTKLTVPIYGNPGDKLFVTVTEGNGIDLNLPAMDSDSDPTDPHDAYRIYGTRYGGTAATATAGAKSGPWYYIKTVSAADLGGTGGGTYFLEYLDAEIEGAPRLVSFDNDPPCDAEFIASASGYPVLISCQGKATTDKPNGTSPGPSIVPFKPSNLAAAPLVLDTGQRNEVPTSPPETIIGFYLANGAMYLLTANSLPVAFFTGVSQVPISTRPFWKSGFKNPFAICFAQNKLYGFTTGGALRSNGVSMTGDGAPAGSENDDFALDVKESTLDWMSERVQVKEDPKNKCICLCYGGAYQNEAGFWVSIILPFIPGSESWSLPIIVSSDTKDMIITGVATVGGHLEFIAGGRDGSGGMQEATYRFDGGLNEGETVEYSLAAAFTDDGVPDRPKKVKYPSVKGLLTNATLGIFGATTEEEVDVALLDEGNSASLCGAIPLSDSTKVVVREREQVEVVGLSVYSIQIEGIYDGSNIVNGIPVRDRIDSVSFEVDIYGARR